MALGCTSCYRLTELFTTDSGEKRHGNTRQEVSREGREQGQECNEEIEREEAQGLRARRALPFMTDARDERASLVAAAA